MMSKELQFEIAMLALLGEIGKLNPTSDDHWKVLKDLYFKYVDIFDDIKSSDGKNVKD